MPTKFGQQQEAHRLHRRAPASRVGELPALTALTKLSLDCPLDLRFYEFYWNCGVMKSITYVFLIPGLGSIPTRASIFKSFLFNPVRLFGRGFDPNAGIERDHLEKHQGSRFANPPPVHSFHFADR